MSTTVPSTATFDVYQAVTDKIVKAIEAGAGDYVMPWHSRGAPIGRPTNAATKLSYRGVNVVGLWAEATLSGYGSGAWATFRQWQKLGARVRTGERGTTIVFYKKLDRGQADEEDESKGRRMMARASWVFNACQVEGWERPSPAISDRAAVLEHVETFVAATGAQVRWGCEGARYRIREDIIEMPGRAWFWGTSISSSTESVYATLLHELTHWTGAPHRLDRTFGERFGDGAYAFEELVAELGAAFLCSDLGVSNEPRADHAAYLASWLQVLKEDRRAIFSAAKLATTAADYLSNVSAPK